MSHQDPDDFGRFSEIPFYTSPVTQQTGSNSRETDMIQLDGPTTTNVSRNSSKKGHRTQRSDDFIKDFDLISISNPSGQKRGSTSSTTHRSSLESPKNREFNYISSPLENPRQKESDQESWIKVDLTQCQFIYPTRTQSHIKSIELGTMALLYRCNKGVVSICFNKMQHEAAISLSQLTGFCVDDGKLLIKLKKDYQHHFNYHLGGFPYLLDPTPMHYDPSNNKFSGAQSLLLTPHQSVRLSVLSSLELNIERLYFQKNGIRNEAVREDGPKMYISIVFSNERRAIAFPVNAPFHRLLIFIEKRFGRKIPSLRYMIRKDEWIEVNNDDVWRSVKDDASEARGRLLRLELQVW